MQTRAGGKSHHGVLIFSLLYSPPTPTRARIIFRNFVLSVSTILGNVSTGESLVKVSDPKSFKITDKRYNNEIKRILPLVKGIYL